ncbi:MAG: hypothetical protein JXQ73_06870 [Phycisphaerae bacterium]|nr:hypothetical protein [Phycisphaerae bacterium]
MSRPIILGLVACLCLTVFVCSVPGISHNYGMRSKVDEGLTESGAGLEYNEWLVNLLVVIGLAVISGCLSALFGWPALKSARAPNRVERET